MIKNTLISTLLSLKAHKLRVLLTMIGIIIGITSVVTISTLGEGYKQQLLSATSSMNVDVITFQYTMQKDDEGEMFYYIEPDFHFSRSDLRKLQDIDGVKELSPSYGDSGSVGDVINVNLHYGEGTPSIMVAPFNESEAPEIQHGRNITKDDLNRDVIVLNGSTFKMNQQLGKPNEAVNKIVTVDGYTYKIIGVTKYIDPYKLSLEEQARVFSNGNYMNNFVPRASYNALAKSKPINSIKFRLEPTADKEKVIEEARNRMIQSNPDLKGVFKEDTFIQQQNEQMKSAIGGITSFLMAITAISLLVGGIGVMNIMYVSVTERKREIGIRRAIGAKPRIILLQFLMEAAFITFLGGLIGVVLGYGLSSLVGSFVAIKPIITPQIFLISTAVSIFTGIFFGIIPAINASKMDPIKAIYN